MPADDIVAALRRSFDLRADPTPRGSAPARLWLVDGGPATVGIIASVSDAFCSACDRTRLTADGQVRNCLFASEESDLRGLPGPAPTAMPHSSRRGARRCGARRPGTGSTIRTSCSRAAR